MSDIEEIVAAARKVCAPEPVDLDGSEVCIVPVADIIALYEAVEGAPGRDDDITEDWLAEVGFGRRDPGQLEPFAHWIIEFDEHGDHGLYVETTKPGWFNRNGEHINADAGWFLWIGRDSQHIHTRHVFKRSEIIALIEALSGQPWTPEAMKYRRVPVALPPAPEGEGTQQAEPATPSHALPGELVEAAKDAIEKWKWWSADQDERCQSVMHDGMHYLAKALSALPLPTVAQVRAEYLEELIAEADKMARSTKDRPGATHLNHMYCYAMAFLERKSADLHQLKGKGDV